MTSQKFIGDSKMFEYDKYYRECIQLNKPFVKARVNPQHGNYFVQIDLVTCNYKLTKSDQQEIKNFVSNEIHFVNSTHEKPFHDYHIDPELAWFDGISKEHLSLFCEFLFDLTQKGKSESN